MKIKYICLALLFFFIALSSSCLAQGYDFTDYKPNPGENDPYMVYHIKPQGIKKLNYHDSAFFMATLLSKTKGVIPGANGFYLSRSKYSSDGIRLTLFIKNKDSEKEVTKWVTSLVDDQVVKIIPYVSIPYDESVMTNYYKGNEKSFRKFLSIYTPIMLECMKIDLKKTQNEITSLMENGGMNIELLESSPYFMSLSYDERSDFVKSLYFNRKWTHMVINFVLGYDNEPCP
jgi:hypothetical protein